MVVTALGPRSLGQLLFELPKATACFLKKHGHLAVYAVRLLQLMQERADRLGPLGVGPQIANILPSARSPAQFVVRSSLLAVFRSDKTLSRQGLDIRRQQAQPGQLVAPGRGRFCFDQFAQALRKKHKSLTILLMFPVKQRTCLNNSDGSGVHTP